MGLLERLRLRAPRTEPDRSLEELRSRGTRLHLEPPDASPRDGRKEPDLKIAWWWHDGARTVVLGRQVVSILGPTEIRGRPLCFSAAEQIVIVGGGDPPPGTVHRARGASLTLDPHRYAYPSDPAPEPATPTALAPLLGRTVELRVVGGRTATHGGVLMRDGTEDLPVPRGRLLAARAGGGHVVLVLDDHTVAVLHEPCRFEPGDDGAVRLEGDLGRVVLDVPVPEVHVARDAQLQVRPTGDEPHTDPPTDGASA